MSSNIGPTHLALVSASLSICNFNICQHLSVITEKSSFLCVF